MFDSQRSRLLAISAGLSMVLVLQGRLVMADSPETSLPKAASVPVRDIGDIAQALRAFIEPEIEQKQIPALSIALVEGDKIVWSEGFGVAKSATKTPATADTVYRVGSISKLLTDVAVMQLVADGKLDLDADIATVLPDFHPRNDSGTPITLRLLMSHRSGLVRESPVGNYFDPTEPTLAQTVESLNSTSLVYPPNTKTKYSNAAVSVAGYALEKVAGEPFEEHMANKLLGPLGMSSSSYRRLDPQRFPVAEGWMWGHDGQRFIAPDFALGTLPAGNLYSSVNDLGRFLIAVLNDGQLDGQQVLNADLLKQMLSPTAKDDGPRTFGIGFHLSEFDGEPLFGHAGAVYGFATQFRGLPERKLGVVIVCSLDCANGFESRIADYALRLLKAKQDGKTVEPPERSTPVDAQLAKALQGRYESDGKHIELVEYLGKLSLQTDASLREVRQGNNELVLDDVFGFGPEIKQSENGEIVYQDKTWKKLPAEVPPEAPEHWRGLIGMYGWPHNPLYIYENHGQLWALIEWFEFDPLTPIDENTFAFPNAGMYIGEQFKFERDGHGVAQRVIVASVPFERMPMSAPGETFKIKPLKPTAELRELALKANPPAESGEFREPDLVELTSLDASIKLDIRYASENNFVGSRFYEQPRAFMQRPAAEALVRVHRKAQEQGLGLLIYDAYRPWYVTKMFWEATPTEMKHFVADPSKGSRHNRGCAVDLTFYDLKTGNPVETVAGYDEFSTRAYPMSPGGTSRERYYRTLLRDLMESEGFTIYEFEWWHFDYKDWKSYPILNVPFETLGKSGDSR